MYHFLEKLEVSAVTSLFPTSCFISSNYVSSAGVRNCSSIQVRIFAKRLGLSGFLKNGSPEESAISAGVPLKAPGFQSLTLLPGVSSTSQPASRVPRPETQQTLRKPTFRNISVTNSSDEGLNAVYKKGSVIYLFVLIPVIVSVTVLGNILVILAFVIDNRLRSPGNFFLLNLALCDFFIGAFCIPVSASYIITDKWTLGKCFCRLWLISDNLMCTASVFNIVLISYDRFVSITFAVSYHSQQKTHCQTMLKMTAVWVFSFLLYGPAIIFWEYVDNQHSFPEDLCFPPYSYNMYFLLGASSVDFFLPLISISYFNLSIYWSIRKRSKKKSQHPPFPSDKEDVKMESFMISGNIVLESVRRAFVVQRNESLKNCRQMLPHGGIVAIPVEH
ncbi:muscarinic acetylcholine receptor M3-like [Pelodytes ibericus]